MLHKAWSSKGEMPYSFPRSSSKFRGHTGQNITDFDPNWAFPDYRPVAAFKSLRFALLDFFRFWHDCWLWTIDYLIRFWLTSVVTLTFSFQGQIWNLLYISQKWSNCHETKSRHTDWILGLKFDHRVWPWLWPWPWIFKVKYRICYISAQNGPINTKWKTNISIELKASNVTIRFDLGHDLDLEFSRSNMEFAISQPKWCDCHETKSKYIDWTSGLKCDHQIGPCQWPWPWIFKGRYEICYFQKWSDCHERRRKHIDWSPGLKCDQWVWPWPSPWPLIIKVKCDLDLWPHMTLTMDFHGQILK